MKSMIRGKSNNIKMLLFLCHEHWKYYDFEEGKAGEGELQKQCFSYSFNDICKRTGIARDRAKKILDEMLITELIVKGKAKKKGWRAEFFYAFKECLSKDTAFKFKSLWNEYLTDKNKVINDLDDFFNENGSDILNKITDKSLI